MAADDPVERAAADRACASGEAEGERRSDPDVPDSRVVGRADGRGRSDDEQRLGRGSVDGLAEDVDQYGDGEDRAAATDEAEAHADRDTEGEREQLAGHRQPDEPRAWRARLSFRSPAAAG